MLYSQPSLLECASQSLSLYAKILQENYFWLQEDHVYDELNWIGIVSLLYLTLEL